MEKVSMESQPSGEMLIDLPETVESDKTLKKDTKKGTRRKRGQLSPVPIISNRSRRSSQTFNNNGMQNAQNIYNLNSTFTDEVDREGEELLDEEWEEESFEDKA